MTFKTVCRGCDMKWDVRGERSRWNSWRRHNSISVTETCAIIGHHLLLYTVYRVCQKIAACDIRILNSKRQIWQKPRSFRSHHEITPESSHLSTTTTTEKSKGYVTHGHETRVLYVHSTFWEGKVV